MTRARASGDPNLDPLVRRPIMALLELLGRRWALRVLWELRNGPLTSRALREVAEISPTVLQARINELRDAGMVDLSGRGGYALTAVGEDLLRAFAPLYSFAGRWAAMQSPGSSGEGTNERLDPAADEDYSIRPAAHVPQLRRPQPIRSRRARKPSRGADPRPS